MRDSKEIKKALINDLVQSSNMLNSNQADHFSVAAENLDNRDGVTDRHVCIYQGYRSPNVTVGAGEAYNTVQEFIVQIYVQYRRQKGNEANYEDVFSDLVDDVFNWIQSLADGNRLYNVTSTKLRVPKEGEGDLFSDQRQPIRTAKSSYTQIYMETIRKSS